MKAGFLLAAVALGLGACGEQGESAAPAASEAPSTHPESGLPVIPLTVTHAGDSYRFRVELARSPQEQATGLMFRTALGPEEGMLFPMDPPGAASFWMRNTVIPLDLLFVAPDGRIANIAANAKPYDETHLESGGTVKAVLEIPGGRSAELGIAAGDKVEW